MHNTRTTSMLIFLTIAAVVVTVGAVSKRKPAPAVRVVAEPGALKAITLNTGAYTVGPGKIDKRSVKITTEQNMHIVALEHFVGVAKGSLSDNGHILSTSPDNPWVKWEKAGTGMEPNGTVGYFGYGGRDYYSEVDGVDDVMAYESFPSDTHVLIPAGETFYMHCYAHNFSPENAGGFHHMVRVLYW